MIKFDTNQVRARFRSVGTLMTFLLVSASSASIGCKANHVSQRAKFPNMEVVTPTPISDEAFGRSLFAVLKDGGNSPARLSLLAGVVRKQFARAAHRFSAGQPDRGLAAVKGALFLIRAGELRLEMLDPSAAAALDGAHRAVAPIGLEGPTLAFLRLQSASLPKDHPAQAGIQRHMDALAAWMKDTRQRSDVENASADAKAFGERAMLEPSPESLEEAKEKTDLWLLSSLELRKKFRPSVRPSNRDEMIEAYRALRTGAITMAGLYLRHGDAAGATKALERSEARNVVPPELYERLQTAATLGDPDAWRELAALYSSAASAGGTEELVMPKGIAEGASWGAILAAYRAEPTRLSAAGPLAVMLAKYGMPEASPLVLTAVVKSSPKPSIVNSSLRVVAGIMLQEDSFHDHASAERVFAASRELLAIADAVHAQKKLDPSPARIRSMMAALYIRSGNLDKATPMLEQALKYEPSLQGYSSLAALRFQAGDRAGALAAIQKALSSPDASDSPVGRADAHLLAFRVHRAAGNKDAARASLAAALKDALDARSRAQTDIAHASADRVLAKLAYYYGDHKAWKRAVGRMLSRANLDPRVLSMALIEATSTGLLYGDLRTANKALEETLGAASSDDVVYAALWVQLAEKAAKESGDGVAKQALSSVDKSAGWAYHLAQYGLGQLDDAALLGKASNIIERTEAEFYISMRKRVAGDKSEDSKLTAISTSSAIDLVETHLARELTQPASSTAWGPAPSTLP